MQVVDLKKLYDEEFKKGHARVSSRQTPQTLTADYHYDGFGNAHNIALNEETGYAYVIGSNTCKGGLHVIDVAADEPTFAGCFSDDGYTHDCQCLVYKDDYPDEKYRGREICLNFNEDTLTIVDVEDKNDMKEISRISYNGVQYSHQGWLTEDGKYCLLDDELDEQVGSTYIDSQDTLEHGGRTRTLVWNLENLENPVWETSHLSDQTAIDHNLYILNGKAYQSNYCAGLRVMDIKNPLQMEEEAFFDLAPYCSGTSFQGSWSNFPYFDDHPDSECDDYDDNLDGDDEYQCVIVAVSSIERGLYTLRVKTKVSEDEE
jgi:choice-of-anchor B domain-containing protein